MNISTTIKNKFVSDSLYNLIAIVVVIIIGVILNVIFGNYYGSSGLGKYTYAITVYNIMASIATLGMKSSAIKYVSEMKGSKNNQDVVISKIMYITTLIFFSLIILSFAVWEVSSNYDFNKKYVLILFYALPFYLINEVLMGILNGLREMKKYAFFRTLRWLLVISFILMSLLKNLQIEQSLFSIMLSELFLSLLLLLQYKCSGILFFKIHKFGEIKNIIVYGVKSMTIQLFTQIDKKMSVLILGLLLVEKDVGVFGFALALSTGLIYIPSVIGMNFNPIISNLWKSNKYKLNIYMSRVKRINFSTTTLFTLLIGITYPLFVRVTMKDPIFIQNLWVFYIILFGCYFMALITPYYAFLQMIGKPEKHLKIRLFVLVCNLIFTFFMVHGFGLIGAAISTALATILFAYLLNRETNKEMLDKGKLLKNMQA